MSFAFMVLHYPKPEHRRTLAQSMREMRELLAGKPDCLTVDPPYLTEEGDCRVGISKWESKEAFRASGITHRPPGEVVEGKTRPA